MRELSLNVMDVVQNSISAGASLVTVSLLESGGNLVITIEDNGRGMTPEQLEMVTDPFFTTRSTREVGLGVPLFKMACEQTGGKFSISSATGAGTLVTARFDATHIDMTPVGDMADTISLLASCNKDVDFVYKREKDGKGFTLDTRELKGILGEVELSNPEVTEWIRDYIVENEAELENPVEHEKISS